MSPNYFGQCRYKDLQPGTDFTCLQEKKEKEKRA
jgi:hypothetical protein